MIKVAIIEDNDQFRTALETIVDQEKDTEGDKSQRPVASPGGPSHLRRQGRQRHDNQK